MKVDERLPSWREFRRYLKHDQRQNRGTREIISRTTCPCIRYIVTVNSLHFNLWTGVQCGEFRPHSSFAAFFQAFSILPIRDTSI